MTGLDAYLLILCRIVLITMSVLILLRSVRSMLSDRYSSEVWGYLYSHGEPLPLLHWESLLGRSFSCDIRFKSRKVNRVHAVLERSDKGTWRIFDIFSKGGVRVNGWRVGEEGIAVSDGDYITLADVTVGFRDISPEARQKLEEGRAETGVSVSPALTLVELTVFQAFLLLEHYMTASAEHFKSVALCFAVLMLLQWACYSAMILMDRRGFEVEILAFYLTTLGLSVTASTAPEDISKELILILVSVGLFLLFGLWFRRLNRTTLLRIPMAVLAGLLLIVNIAAGSSAFGARNWLEIGGFSFQPSELVKVAYIYVGASTLENLYRKKNLYTFIGFSAACVVALALIGDFGTALVFFVCFLVISFMRSGSIATVFLAISGAGLAGFLAVTVKPYIASRFAIWGHVWEDIYDKGYQQTRAMSAAAAGGLVGKGVGRGWLKDVFASNMDMVFALICEELGLIIGICAVAAVIVLALFAVRSARHGRSAYFAIAACATVSMLLTQLSLNVFGSLDLLPFTGVTFPFVSKGGTSLISCWMLMAFIKGADNRKDASFAVRPIKSAASTTLPSAPSPEEVFGSAAASQGVGGDENETALPSPPPPSGDFNEDFEGGFDEAYRAAYREAHAPKPPAPVQALEPVSLVMSGAAREYTSPLSSSIDEAEAELSRRMSHGRSMPEGAVLPSPDYLPPDRSGVWDEDDCPTEYCDSVDSLDRRFMDDAEDRREERRR